MNDSISTKCDIYALLEMLQRRIERLETVLGDRIDETRSLSSPEESPTSSSSAITQEKYGECYKATRDALRHLDDILYLGNSTLAQCYTRIHNYTLEGYQLRQLILAAIAALNSSSTQSRSRMHYKMVRMAYLENCGVDEITSTLPLSKRQYYRELNLAIQAIAHHILGWQ